MTTLTIMIIVAFVLGYACIATESLLKVNKAAIALLMFVACWTLYMFDPMQYLTAIHGYTGDLSGMAAAVTSIIQEHLGDTSTTLFFLMGAMTIVEIVDQNGGFNWVRKVMKTSSKRTLLWRIAFLTFSLVIIAANSGGAFSPIGDVTTIMLWNKGLITAVGVISEILVPSLVSMIIPAFILQYQLKGELHMPEIKEGADASVGDFTERQRKAVFWIGVGGLMFVPVFKSITHLPPFVGILLVLGVLWTTTELFYRHLHRGHDDEGTQKRVTNLLSRVDMSTILFFLGILMAVSCLSEVGVLTALGDGLNTFFDGNHYLVTGIIGVLSSIVDNVPLVAGCMGMYPVDPSVGGDMSVDGIFWQLLAYCAGVGGSMLIIGSAAGVVVMGLEKITFGWYMKRITWIAFVGYLAGIISYYFIRTFVF